MSLQRRKAYNPPRQWTEEEESILLKYLLNRDLNIKQLKTMLPNRTLASIRSKMRKLRIKYDLFGENYRDLKENFTEKIAKKIVPFAVFEAYSGAGHQTLKWIEYSSIVYASDISPYKKDQFFFMMKEKGFNLVDNKNNWFIFNKNSKEIHFFYGDTIDAAAYLKTKKVKIDLLDLDTCGSTLPILPTLLLLLSPMHLVITHGEFHSLRFRREDVLRRILFHRDVNKSPFPMSLEQLARELDKAVKIAALRSHNETNNSFWPELMDEIWLGSKAQGILRRYYILKKPVATADCLNELEKI